MSNKRNTFSHPQLVMTTQDYKDKFNDAGFVYRLASSLEELKKASNYEFLLSALKNPEFFKTASVSDLYKVNAELSHLATLCSIVENDVAEKDLFAISEFEDAKMTLEEIGLKSKNFKCTAVFKDPFSKLIIEPDTLIEIDELHFPNQTNIITAIYKSLKTTTNNKEIVDLFSNGTQKTVLNLKILGEYFQPLD
jgi:hypothetical protein